MIGWQRKRGKNDEIGDNLDELCDEEEIYSNPRDVCLEEEQQPEELQDNVNRQRRYGKDFVIILLQRKTKTQRKFGGPQSI